MTYDNSRDITRRINAAISNAAKNKTKSKNKAEVKISDLTYVLENSKQINKLRRDLAAAQRRALSLQRRNDRLDSLGNRRLVSDTLIFATDTLMLLADDLRAFKNPVIMELDKNIKSTSVVSAETHLIRIMNALNLLSRFNDAPAEPDPVLGDK